MSWSTGSTHLRVCILVPEAGVEPATFPYERNVIPFHHTGEFWSRSRDVRSALLITSEVRRYLRLSGMEPTARIERALHVSGAHGRNRTAA